MITKYENITILEQNLGLYSGGISTIIPDSPEPPKIKWNGAPIGRDQFRLALSFLYWAYEKHSVEAQIRLFYNPISALWETVVFPQYIWSSVHTEEIKEEDNPEKERITEELHSRGFGQAGTGHSHSTMGAFQSGGDLKDELSQHGYHFTVGCMKSKVADFHSRVTFRKVNYTPGKEMLNEGNWLPGLSSHLKDNPLNKFWLSLENLPRFPEEWKARMVERPVAPIVKYPSYPGFSSHQSSLARQWGTSRYTPPTRYKTPITASSRNKTKHMGHTPILRTNGTVLWTRNGKAFSDNFTLTAKNAKPAPAKVGFGDLWDDVFFDLASFRVTDLPDELSERELEFIVDDIESASLAMLRSVDRLSSHVPGKGKEDHRNALLGWLSEFTKELQDLKNPEDWDDLIQQAESKTDPIDFYQGMCDSFQHLCLEDEFDDDDYLLGNCWAT